MRNIGWLGYFSLWWSGLWLAAILILFLAVWQKRISLALETERKLRNFFAVFIVAFAILSIYRVATAAYYSSTKATFFRQELIGYIVFWVLFPPGWFFLEYYALDTGVIKLKKKEDLKTTLENFKAYADFASKVWAAVLACLGGLVALGG